MTAIVVADPAGAGDAAFVAEVTALVNTVYREGESGIWAGDSPRTDEREVASIVRAGELVVARDGGVLLGVARVQQLPGGEGEAGMLAVRPGRRRAGLGGELIAFAEGWARARGLPVTQLELLWPTQWEHPVKVFLRDWYTRIGYEVVRKGDFAEAYPALAPRLVTPCDFLVLHKALNGAGIAGRLGQSQPARRSTR
ncbi:GNAT family N-acetyltransferase [Actinoplanes sp. URMC 104]|uniref:GNAT family N-acetyltransferase n=1 Tax=Actinoplanes sp. URMC 104 TaxID=3423409 RepID=UPI003F1CB952